MARLPFLLAIFLDLIPFLKVIQALLLVLALVMDLVFLLRDRVKDQVLPLKDRVKDLASLVLYLASILQARALDPTFPLPCPNFLPQ